MSDQVRRSLFMMLRDMLGHNEDLIRSIAAACLACLMRWLSTEQLNVILTEHLLGRMLHIWYYRGRGLVLRKIF